MQRIWGAILIAATLLFGVGAGAAGGDYAFEAATPKVELGDDGIVGVRLLNKASGKPVANAVIFQTRLDMSPENMGDMTGKVTPVASDQPGVYRFKVDVGMAGRWALKLAAKVPGEQETIRGEVVVVAKQ